MNTLTKELKGLSSAEDFFRHFDVPYDPRILASCRLHILRRFHDYLDSISGLDDLDPPALDTICRDQLRRAYADFMTGPALHQNAFPRLAQMKGAFVALSAVRLPPKGGAR